MDITLIVAAAIAALPGLAGIALTWRNGHKTDSVGAQVETTREASRQQLEAIAGEVTASNGQTLIALVEKWEGLRIKAERERAEALKRLAAMKREGGGT